MRRSGWSRIFAALLAIGFGFGNAEPAFAVHRCAMHDGAMEDAHGAMAHAHQQESGHHTKHACTCRGDCCAAHIAPPSRCATAIGDGALMAHRPSIGTAPSYLPIAARRRLPPATAPPAPPTRVA